jgi:hypothetical protein
MVEVDLVQVLALLAETHRDRPFAVWVVRALQRLLQPLREGADAAAAPDVGIGRDEDDAVVGADEAERVAQRERAAELVEREAEAASLAGVELVSRLAERLDHERGDRRPRGDEVARHQLVSGVRTRLWCCVEQVLQELLLELATRLLELLQPVHRRSELPAAALGQVDVAVAQRLIGVDEPQIAEQRTLAADRHADARLQAELLLGGRPDRALGGGDALREVQVADVFGVSRVRIAVRRTSSSTPSTGL